MNALRDTMKGLVRGSVIARRCDNLRPGIQMATSRRHRVFFEADDSRVLVICVLHDSMNDHRYLGAPETSDDEA